jgi:hypothetical protein
MKQLSMLPAILSAVRDEFNMSTSDNLIAPSSLKLLPVLSENRTKQQSVTGEIEFNESSV